jgi:hypothetical protein
MHNVIRWSEAGNGSAGNACAFGVDADNDVLYIDKGKTQGREFITSQHLRTVTASATLTAADSGAIILADSTTSIVMQLPATQAGLTFTLVVKQVTAASGHAFSPVAADKFIYASKADDADLVCSAASDVVGDMVTIVGDGVDGWVVVAKTGTWA